MQRHHRETVRESPITNERQARIAGRDFRLRSTDVTQALRTIEPEPIASHFVVIGNRRYPPKQVISAVTGLDRADFTSHQARRTLMRLGFPAGRRATGSSPARAASVSPRSGGPPPTTATESRVDRLRPHMGQWVAVKDDDVMYAAPRPQQVVTWLAAHGQSADSMFRVPEDELAASGLAPL